VAGHYRIELTPAARRDLGALPREVLPRVDARILDLSADPHSPRAKRLVGEEGILRVRVGDYRILYQVDDAAKVVTVVRVRHRRDVYR
jgi:mRNA interferase RelE/StbE